ncbi:MAG: hypothetical protein HC795_18150 [Coleofasciculaceae cyanobacterium RL_1_1]|nr:hypothetical protein [Coleofasciculaceae cyanobacterium RL_1_1]
MSNQEYWLFICVPMSKALPIRVCPDFVIELRSYSDQLAPLHIKMQEYITNGTELGWLLNS